MNHLFKMVHTRLGDDCPQKGVPCHEALHAIAFVLAGHMHELMRGGSAEFDESKYASDLDALTPEKWKQMAQE